MGEWDTEDCADEEIAGDSLRLERLHGVISHFEDSFIDSMNVFCPNMSCVQQAAMAAADDVSSASGDMIDTSALEYVVENANSAEEASMMVEENVEEPTAQDLWDLIG